VTQAASKIAPSPWLSLLARTLLSVVHIRHVTVTLSAA
jgi:hypothetical protein